MIGVLREADASEQRVALVPAVAAALIADGLSVVVERDAGVAAGYPDAAFADVEGQYLHE